MFEVTEDEFLFMIDDRGLVRHVVHARVLGFVSYSHVVLRLYFLLPYRKKTMD